MADPMKGGIEAYDMEHILLPLDSKLTQCVLRLFNNPKFSDLTIRCSSRSWPAHKVVLCTQSEYLSA